MNRAVKLRHLIVREEGVEIGESSEKEKAWSERNLSGKVLSDVK